MRVKFANGQLMVLSLLGLPACDEVSFPAIAGEEFEAALTGASQVPPVTTNATGTALFTVVEDTLLIFSVEVAAIDSTTAVHIHEGAAGVRGDTDTLVVLFTGPSACKTNSGTALSITSSSVANPTVIKTGTAHAQTVGSTGFVRLAGHSGSTPSLNGEHKATYTGDSTFTIPVDVTVGGTGGTAQRFNWNLTSPRCLAGYTGPAGGGQRRPAQLTRLPARYGATPPERMAELIARMRAGTVYVDVHTRLNAAGEVRGQIASR